MKSSHSHDPGKGRKRQRDHSNHHNVGLKCPEALPIAEWERQIVDAVRTHRVLVLTGATGSGKTTQLPAYLYHSGLLTDLAAERDVVSLATAGKRKQSRPLMIAVTQPRRVAAITIARRVALELREPPPSAGGSGAVGYSVRFDDATGPGTRIKFVTDGMLLRCVPDLRGLLICQ
jgi:HrpA-like RNA helicase